VVFDDATVKRIVERCRKTRASMQPFVGFFDAAALPSLDLSECRLGRGTVIPFHGICTHHRTTHNARHTRHDTTHARHTVTCTHH
jgi:hypothetical protein